MSYQLLLIVAIVPVIILLSYIYKRDIEKEPRSLLSKVFKRGCLTVIPSIIFELIFGYFYNISYINNYLIIFIGTFLGVGLIEEFFKWLNVYKTTYNNIEFNHRYDAIVYSVYSSLGFAVVENVLYVLPSDLSTGIMRAFLSVPGHACDSVLMGYFLGKAKYNDIHGKKFLSYINLLLSILIPSIQHTIYDSILFYVNINSEENILYEIFLVFVLITYLVSFLIVKTVSSINKNMDGSYVRYY